MGMHKNVSATQFPRQGDWLGRRTKVIFNYEGPELEGEIVRDDMEEPFKTIIKLDDGRIVLASECQYSPIFRKE